MDAQFMLALGIIFNLLLNGVVLVLVIRLMLSMPEDLRDKVHKIPSLEIAMNGLIDLHKDHEQRLRSVEDKTRNLPFVKAL